MTKSLRSGNRRATSQPPRDPPKVCELSYACELDWEQLERTSRDQVRHCSRCSKSVHIVRTREAFGVAVRFKRCVAIADDNNFVGVIGETGDSMDWLEREWPEIQIRLRREPKDDLVQLLQEMYPALMLDPKSRSALLKRQWVSIGIFDQPETEALRQDAAALGLPVEFRAHPAQP